MWGLNYHRHVLSSSVAILKHGSTQWVLAHVNSCNDTAGILSNKDHISSMLGELQSLSESFRSEELLH